MALGKGTALEIKYTESKRCKMMHSFCTFRVIGTQSKTFLTSGDSTGNSAYNEEIFSLVTSIYFSLDKKRNVLKFK